MSHTFLHFGRLILASASPRRKEILEAAGLEFDIVPSATEERQQEGESPEDFVRPISAAKAMDVLRRLGSPHRRPVLAADTVVVIGGTTLGKPVSSEDAARMLRLLSGREHRVLTGVCLGVLDREKRRR